MLINWIKLLIIKLKLLINILTAPTTITNLYIIILSIQVDRKEE